MELARLLAIAKKLRQHDSGEVMHEIGTRAVTKTSLTAVERWFTSAIMTVLFLVLSILLPTHGAVAQPSPSEAIDDSATPMSPPELTFPSDSITSPQYATSATTAFGPAGCVAKANNPHESTSQKTRGRIKGTMQNKCPVAVLNNSVEAKLWQKRWWGYQKIAGPVFSSLSKAKLKKISAVGPQCSNGQTYRLTGYGHYSWNGTHFVSPEKRNTKTVSC